MIEKLPNNLIEFVNFGEGIMVEFKEARKKLPSNLFETVCSMLNRNGGHIFLGIKDNSEVIGIYKDYVKNIKKEFVDLCNNPEKIFPTVHLDIKEYLYKENIFYIFMFMKVLMCIKRQIRFMTEMKMVILISPTILLKFQICILEKGTLILKIRYIPLQQLTT